MSPPPKETKMMTTTTAATTEPPVGAVIKASGASDDGFNFPLVIGLIIVGVILGILFVLIFVFGARRCVKGPKVKPAEEATEDAEAYTNALYEDIPSRPSSIYPPDKIPYVRPADAKNAKHVHFERGNPAFESDVEDEEELEGAVGGVPLPVHPPPYSEKDAQMAHIMSHVTDLDDEKKKLPLFEDEDTEYLEAGKDPPPYSTASPIAQVELDNDSLPEKPPIDVLY